MDEEGAGADRCHLIKKPHLPEDAELFGATRSYKLYYSRLAKKIIIETVDYHSGDLYLSKSELEELLGRL